MSNRDKHINNGKSDLNRYRKDGLSGSERNSFERELQKDPFMEDALDGLSNLSEEEMAQDLKSLSGRIGKRIKRRGQIFYRVAAVAVILIGISSVLLVRQLREPVMMAENVVPGYDSLSRKPIIESNESVEIAERIEKEADISQTERAKKGDTEPESAAENIVEDRSEIIIGIAEAIDEVRLDSGVRVLAQLNEDRKIESEQISIADKNMVVSAAVEEENVASKARKAGGVERQKVIPSVSQTEKKESAAAVSATLVSGRVIAEEDNLPLPGASIVIKGTSRGVTSDFDGTFSIAADSGDILVASFIGMESTELKLGEGFVSDILLQPDLLALDEVVTVAYGVKRGIDEYETGAVSEVILDKESSDYRRPEPVVGMVEYRAYIEDNQLFPNRWTRSDREVVRIRFDIAVNGAIRNFEIINSPDLTFSNEAIRLIKNGPAWKCAVSDGVNVEESVNLRIVFRR